MAAAAGLLLLGWRGGDKGKSRDGSEIKGRFVTVHSIPFFFLRNVSFLPAFLTQQNWIFVRVMEVSST